jgi:hypothetical protein
VFCKVAEAVQVDLRGADVLGRCGPHELLALLPGTDRAAAEAVARRLRTIANSTPVVVGKEVVTVSVTVGVATTSDGDQELFVQALQQALDADRAGRAGPTPAPTPPPPPPSDPRITDFSAPPPEAPLFTQASPPPPPPPPETWGNLPAPAPPATDADPTFGKKGWRFFSSR